MNKNHEQIPASTLLFIDKLMQFLGDALIRIRSLSLKHDSVERVSKLPNGVPLINKDGINNNVHRRAVARIIVD